jgi:hypothetical protein
MEELAGPDCKPRRDQHWGQWGGKWRGRVGGGRSTSGDRATGYPAVFGSTPEDKQGEVLGSSEEVAMGAKRRLTNKKWQCYI